MSTDTERPGALIYKQRLATRVTHWAWAIWPLPASWRGGSSI